MKLIVYGSFSCPYSFLASLRADRLTERGVADMEWRAVVHDPEVPQRGLPVSGQTAEMFDQELDQIRGLLRSGEQYPATRPALLPSTMLAVAAYSAMEGAHANRIRALLFGALWVRGLNIGDPAVLRELGCPVTSPAAAMERWRADWLSLEQPMVPMLVLPGGAVSRGLGALKRLADFSPDGSTARSAQRTIPDAGD